MTYAVEVPEGVLVEPAPPGLSPYSWRGRCRIEGCSNPATDPHHIIPRGRLGGAYRYVLLDGEPVGNIAGLCRLHHDRITTGESVLMWRDDAWWYQSPRRTVRLRSLAGAASPSQRCCPHCGQSYPKPRAYELRTRERQGVMIHAPTDQGEDGPQLLASLVEQVGEKIGLDNPRSASASYFAVMTALTAVLVDDGALEGLRQHLNGHDR